MAILFAAGSAGICGGCTTAGESKSVKASDGESGSIGLALTVAGTTLNSASFTITGPSSFMKSGTLDLSNSGTLSASIGGIPAGSGFSITIAATSSDGATTCSGAATFNVTAHATTTVSVNLTCHEAPRTGAVAVNGSINICPVVEGISASPSEVVVGHTLTLAASAHDRDSGPAALVYRWSASSGSFSDVASASPTFTCLAPGKFTLTVSASDGDPAASCIDSSSVQIICSLPGAGSVAPSTMAVYGDAPYGTTATDTSQTLATPAFINSVNADPKVSLVLHVGDIHSGKQNCTQAYDQTVFDMWTAFQDPVVYTPGDNEWADCNKIGEGGGLYNGATMQIDYVKDAMGNPVDYASGDPIANLALIRSMFFPQVGMSLGLSKMQVLSQAQFFDPTHPSDASYVENVMFERSKVLFVTVNMPGGSNNDIDVWYAAPTATAAQTQEAADRTGADLRWLDAAFAQAQADGVVAVVIQSQADVWDAEKGAAHQTGYESFVANVASHTMAFGKPVLMFNGDSHIYKSDSPLLPSDPAYAMHATAGYNVPNFHRIVVHGSTLPFEYLRLTIDPSVNAALSATTFGPFSWERILP